MALCRVALAGSRHPGRRSDGVSPRRWLILEDEAHHPGWSTPSRHRSPQRPTGVRQDPLRHAAPIRHLDRSQVGHRPAERRLPTARREKLPGCEVRKRILLG